jgi:anti-sigma regulatory factor (Ser/Thr protein kinase)
LGGIVAGYVQSTMGRVTELRLPADTSYIVVAKRCASALASVAGFDVESVDDLTIAVAQAYENAVDCLHRAQALAGEVRLTFKLEEQSIEVTVKSTVSREAELQARMREAAQRAQEQELKRQQAVQLAAGTDLALRLMGLLVDDHSYRLDQRTGGLRVRLTKYRVS